MGNTGLKEGARGHLRRAKPYLVLGPTFRQVEAGCDRPIKAPKSMNSGRQNAQVELNSALRRLVTSMVRCHTELYKAYTEDGEFREWLNAEMFRATYH